MVLNWLWYQNGSYSNNCLKCYFFKKTEWKQLFSLMVFRILMLHNCDVYIIVDFLIESHLDSMSLGDFNWDACKNLSTRRTTSSNLDGYLSSSKTFQWKLAWWGSTMTQSIYSQMGQATVSVTVLLTATMLVLVPCLPFQQLFRLQKLSTIYRLESGYVSLFGCSVTYDCSRCWGNHGYFLIQSHILESLCHWAHQWL